MGYDTRFKESFKFNKKVSIELKEYLDKFSKTRRVKRDPEIIKKIFPNWEDFSYKGDLGVEGEYFIGGLGPYGQDHDASVLNNNKPPKNQPGLWCNWVINDDCIELIWDGAEKFYNYIDWLKYLINNFF